MLPEVGNYLKRLKATHDEDTIDRMNYVYTPTILLIFSILLTAKQYVGEPLQCWVPHQFKDGWEKYVERHCFIENTYFARIDEQFPDTEGKQKRELAYYQWLPVILICEAFLCYAPKIVWKFLSKHKGMDLSNFILMSMLTVKKGNVAELKMGDAMLQPLIEHFQRYTRNKHVNDSPVKFGSYVTILYLIVKLLFLINIILQFVLLNQFLGPQYTFWGIGIIADLFTGRNWQESGHFPRVTFCDVQIRELGNIHNWTIQCVLMVNMFAEKIFIFIWFWFSLMGLLTLLNLAYWIFITFEPRQSIHFVQKYLGFIRKQVDGESVKEFIDTVLAKDGMTTLRLMSENSGDFAVANIIKKLWANYAAAEPPSPDDSHDETDTGYLENGKVAYADDK